MLVYERRCEDRRLVIALNLGNVPHTVRLDGAGRVLLLTGPDLDGRPWSGEINLRGNEGVIAGRES